MHLSVCVFDIINIAKICTFNCVINTHVFTDLFDYHRHLFDYFFENTIGIIVVDGGVVGIIIVVVCIIIVSGIIIVFGIIILVGMIIVVGIIIVAGIIISVCPLWRRLYFSRMLLCRIESTG